MPDFTRFLPECDKECDPAPWVSRPPRSCFVLVFLIGLRTITPAPPKYDAPVPQSADVFVSYSREDAARVSNLVAKLRAAGVSLWIDQGGIDAASQWSEQIVNALESAKALLLMVSESAVHSHNVAKEVVLVSERKGHILPVHLQPTAIPPALKYQLAGIQHVEYFTRLRQRAEGDPARARATGRASSHRRQPPPHSAAQRGADTPAAPRTPRSPRASSAARSR